MVNLGLEIFALDLSTANPDMGDSAIVETVGLGGMAMAASPAAARFVGAGGFAEAMLAGTGQVGAGVVRAPLGCFTAALEALVAARDLMRA